MTENAIAESSQYELSSAEARALLPRVQALVTPERLAHVRRVAELALGIGRSNGFSPEDLERVELAALLHDAARDMTDEQLLALVTPRNAVEASHPLAMHGRAARRLAEEWGVTDPVVLGAVEGHVFGVEAGDRVGAALYVADVSEPGRGVNEDVRELAMRDLWAAYARAVESKVAYLRGAGKEIHPDTLRAYESLRGRDARQG
ncbi:MAG TPA: bis(5'-nucleosyl)-tetraphosphatase (symmetrical) YqeK [Trueperaceae bacterium]|nr:bis(5'-nucleosyl)-tetraphosphatase (symmetrical) YqeK [Trueperaceae bacterium]